MTSLLQVAKNVVKLSDIILVVVDARQPEITLNPLVEELARGKKLLYVINKIDLVPEDDWKRMRRKIKPSIAVSAKLHLGTMMLLRKINEIAHGEECTVGVLGYPNTGKSSLINALKSRGSTSVSPQAGHTKALQKVRVSKTVMLIDAPGIIPRTDVNDVDQKLKHQFLGTHDVHRIKEPDLAAVRLMQEYPGLVEEYYGVPIIEDFDETLALIAKKKGIVGPGGKGDVPRLARALIRDFQTGKMKPATGHDW